MKNWGKAHQRASRHVGIMSAVILLDLIFACTNCLAASDLVITSEDFPWEVGKKLTWTWRNADGTQSGRWQIAILGKLTISETTLYRETLIMEGTSRRPDYYIEKTENEVFGRTWLGAKTRDFRIPLPLRKGMTYEYESFGATVKARVEGPEEVSIPLGKFKCLVLILERESKGSFRTQKYWLASDIGEVQFTVPVGDQDYTASLIGVEGPAPRPPEQGAFVLSNFDSGDPLVSPLFPNARWQGVGGRTDVSSICDVEPSDSALGTPFCMRWAYHTRGTWVAAQMLLSGTWGEPVDLSSYDSISFCIKGLTERSCGFRLQSAPWTHEGLTGADIPIKITPEWQKIVIPLKTDPKLMNLDLTRAYTVEFTDWDADFAANVIWIDEIVLHRVGKAAN